MLYVIMYHDFDWHEIVGDDNGNVLFNLPEARNFLLDTFNKNFDIYDIDDFDITKYSVSYIQSDDINEITVYENDDIWFTFYIKQLKAREIL